jgi:hypothetical protein
VSIVMFESMAVEPQNLTFSLRKSDPPTNQTGNTGGPFRSHDLSDQELIEYLIGQLTHGRRIDLNILVSDIATSIALIERDAAAQLAKWVCPCFQKLIADLRC